MRLKRRSSRRVVPARVAASAAYQDPFREEIASQPHSHDVEVRLAVVAQLAHSAQFPTRHARLYGHPVGDARRADVCLRAMRLVRSGKQS